VAVNIQLPTLPRLPPPLLCCAGELQTPSSRFKWARAIIASVEAESVNSPLLAAITNTAPVAAAASLSVFMPSAAPAAVGRHDSSRASTQVSFASSSAAAVRTAESVHLQMSAGGGSGAGSKSTSGVITLLDVQMRWAAIKTVLALADPRHLLAAETFSVIYEWVAAHIAAYVVPGFLASPEAMRYATTVAALPAPGGISSAPLRLLRASNQELHASVFERLGCIGQGSYGSVHVWRHRLTGTCYAVKSMSKRVLKHKASVHTVVRELACTLAVQSHYVCGCEFSFSDAEHVHMGMRMCWRGDLERWLLAQPQRRFDETTARFYAGQIAMALKHLHQAGVLHRCVEAKRWQLLPGGR